MSTDDDDGPDDGPEGSETGPAEGAETGGTSAARRKRRRRRRKPGDAPAGEPAAASAAGEQPQPSPHPERVRPEGPPREDRPRRDWRDRNVGSGAPPGPTSGAGETSARADHSTDHAAVRGSDTLAGGNGPGGSDDGPRDTTGVVDGGGASADPREGRRRRRRGERSDAPPQAAQAPAQRAPAREPRPPRDARPGGGNPPRAGRENTPRPPREARGPDPRANRDNAPRSSPVETFHDDGTPGAGAASPPNQPRGRGRGENREPRRERATPDGGPERKPQEFAPPTAPSLGQRPRPPTDDLESEPSSEVRGEAWGTDDDGPAPDIQLVSSFPSDAGHDDVEPLTFPLLAVAPAPFGGDVAGVIGVRFVAGGRVMWSDAGDADYAIGERVLVDTERGARLATVATPPTRRTTRERGVRRVIRRANDQDVRGEREGDADSQQALRIAKDAASALRMPMKVYRVEVHADRGGGLRGAKLNVYYTSDERLDLRAFIADVQRETGARLELRQLGVRDEAKAVGGIGSCGLTLCCTTWLPDFVPVSIKMAKDQGLVLSPTKVSGQCGRLKCCLVYEQAGYAEMRKGLPKLGKRVIAPRGEGRVVEVDVLRQRVRVSFGMGDTEMMPAADVKSLFPPGGGGGDGEDRPERAPRGDRPERAPRGERKRDDRDRRDAAPAGDAPAPHDDDPAKLAGDLYADLDEPEDEDDAGPTDDPSSMHHAGDDDADSPDDPSSDEFKP